MIGIRILKIDAEMAETIEFKDGTCNFEINILPSLVGRFRGVQSWNNGKSGAKLDLTSSTTPGLQIHKVDHTRTANPCDWLLCCRASLLLVGCPHSLVYFHLEDSFLYLSNPTSGNLLSIIP